MLSSGVRRERVIALLSSIMTHNRGYQNNTSTRCVVGEGPLLPDWLTPLSSAVSSDTLGGSGWTSNQTHYTYFVFRGGHGTCSGIKLNAVVVFHSYTLTSAKSELGSFLSIQAAVIQSAFIPIDLLSFFLLISYYKKDKGIYE